ncbi:hypothetical protein RGK87_00005, partial [Agrobacterium fabacearum]|uniref:hypothetical protein n=1 Tax=Agrobacterium tumefaciens TaxID=358 RepID=UPI001AD8D5CA
SSQKPRSLSCGVFLLQNTSNNIQTNISSHRPQLALFFMGLIQPFCVAIAPDLAMMYTLPSS